MSKKYETIEVTQLSPALGGIISGVNIATGISDEQFSEIHHAFVENSVIFFRDQNITPDQHIAFARRWGEINVNRFFKTTDTHPNIAEVRKEPNQKINIGSSWHTDHSYDQAPALGSILYAKEVPSIGGDTLFSSMYAAYDGLSVGMKTLLSNLSADHSSRHAFGPSAYLNADLEDLTDRYQNAELANQDATHPIFIKHPLSGKSALYVNQVFTVKINGWSTEESAPLLNYLYQHASQNEFTCRFKWEKDSIAIWDNRATHHLALNDYHGERRLMHRITIEGELLLAAS